MNFDVSVGRYEDFDRVLERLGGLEKFVRPGAKVLIKPNLCAPKGSETGITTNPRLVEKVIGKLKKITDNIVIGEGPIPVFGHLSEGQHPLLYEIAKKHNVPIVDLNYTEAVIKRGFAVARAVVESDAVINMPVLKTHMRAGVTCAVKNLMGTAPLRVKHEMHKNGLEEQIVSLAETVVPVLNIVDATTCHEGDGPTNGTPREVGIVIAGANMVAVDAVACRVIGLKPETVPYLRLAAKRGLGPISGVEPMGFEDQWELKFKRPLLYRNPLVRLFVRFAESPLLRFFERRNKVVFDPKLCVKCGLCVKACPVEALRMGDNAPELDPEKCILCLCCHEACLKGAITLKKHGLPTTGVLQKWDTKKRD